MTEDDLPDIKLPADWPDHVVRAILHLISLAHYVFMRALGLAMQLPSDGVRLRVEVARLQQTLLWRHEEIALLHSRLGRIDPHRRPHYWAHERLNILELQAATGWSNAETARRFLVLPETISEWKRRDDGLVGPPEPVNKYPDLTRYAVQRLKTLCPLLGKQRIADVLCRAGIHLAMSTVGRILKEPPVDPPMEDGVVQMGPALPGESLDDGDFDEDNDAPEEAEKQRKIAAKYPGHLWHVDLTVVPTADGLAAPWHPFALQQAWPFAWWVAIAVDSFSRCVMGVGIFTKEPTSEDVKQWFADLIEATGMCQWAPKTGQ